METLDTLLARKAALDGAISRIDVWLLVFGILVVVGVAGESVFGIRAWWNNRKLHSVQQSIDEMRRGETVKLESDVASARARQAEAELKLAEIDAARQPRNLPVDCFLSALKDKPTGTVTVLYQPENSEAYLFSLEIRGNLRRAGWNVPESPSPIPSNFVPGYIRGTPVESDAQRIPSAMRAGGAAQGVSIVAKSINIMAFRSDDGTAFSALYWAFRKCAARPSLGTATDATLPNDAFLIIVGSKN